MPRIYAPPNSYRGQPTSPYKNNAIDDRDESMYRPPVATETMIHPVEVPTPSHSGDYEMHFKKIAGPFRIDSTPTGAPRDFRLAGHPGGRLTTCCSTW